MMESYPKIHALGVRYISDIWDGPVEITEKVDGSQFKFGLDPETNEVRFRSKNSEIYPDACHNIFRPAVEHVLGMKESLIPGYTYYGETLAKPKHNALTYSRVPSGHIALFSVKTDDMLADFGWLNYGLMVGLAQVLGVDVVPRFEIKSAEQMIEALATTDSFLGGCKVEGFVVKNYSKPYMLGNMVVPFMAGKFVSAAFKEVQRGEKYSRPTKKDILSLAEQYRTEARWEKAIQHLREAGKFDASLKDIGPVIREVHQDLASEEKENIKQELYDMFWKEIQRTSTRGFPEWYTDKLARGHFDGYSRHTRIWCRLPHRL